MAEQRVEMSVPDAFRLLNQAWYCVLVGARLGDDVPEELAFELRALEAMTGEYMVGVNPLSEALAAIRGDE